MGAGSGNRPQHSGSFHFPAPQQGRNRRRRQIDTDHSRLRLHHTRKRRLMRFGSIRTRLTAWYVVMLALGLSVFGVGSWFAMRASAFHAIDEELRDRIHGIRKFME